ncbi:dihydroorotase [Candidatus Desulfofervidus auxilii]|uniref:Dihydroorotase n=1 Tax=Desulfofervidus auxilii TaxID=1621989 RepID=A0A7U4QLF6_DESA2|nr:dihydroorotase [Candidatus Desulfofervidus auxilii]AMM41513.1 dihydroorotase [Candidatus Desulfofervidus auxilii]
MRLVIKSGYVIDPSQSLDGIFDVLVEDGIIKAIDTNIDIQGAEVIHAQGKIVTPGLIDVHVHLREPGFEYKETIHTGAKAAVAGGFTAVCCMANTNPVNDNQEVTRYILKRATECGLARVYPIGAVSKQLKGEELACIGELKEAGVVALSDDGNPIVNSGFLRRALEYAKYFNLPIISHAEDRSLAPAGVMNEGKISTLLGLPGIPAISEEIMVFRDIKLAELTNWHIHIAHVSTAGSIELIRRAKEKKIKVTAETCPHYFTLTEEAAKEFNPNTKVSPPLRTATDVEAIKQALKEGIIDIIATDHAPHQFLEKEVPFEQAPSGIIGLESALPISLKLVEEGVLTWPQLITKMSYAPAKVFNLPGGSLKPGNLADITIIDPNFSYKIDVNQFYSKGRNCPFHGWEVKGKAIMTLIGGNIVYRISEKQQK